MKIKKWLTVASNGSARLTAGRNSLNIDEVAILLTIYLPDALFQKPNLQASITVPDEAAAGNLINTVVCDNVEEAIQQATGLEFAISIENNNGDEDD